MFVTFTFPQFQETGEDNFVYMAKNTLHCSFCGRSRDEVKILIAGQEGHICENCVEHAQEIIEQELMIRNDTSSNPSQFKLNVKKPVEVKRFLDEYVIGQDDAKKVLAVAALFARHSSRDVWGLPLVCDHVYSDFCDCFLLGRIDAEPVNAGLFNYFHIHSHS